MSLELRMYTVVPYNISPIQQGIQSLHAVVRYARAVRNFPELEKQYNEWADSHETVIIKNGGTTNTNEKLLGTLNVLYNELSDLGATIQPFYEPDLGEQLTAFAILVDERVFNKELYPDFTDYVKVEKVEFDYSQLKEYGDWVELVGGKLNVELRRLLNPLRLA